MTSDEAGATMINVQDFLVTRFEDEGPKVRRPSWDETWLAVARTISERSTCPRAHVGVVVVTPDNQLVSVGYNGSPSGQPHCTDEGCLLDKDGSCVRTIHAEMNALRRASWRSIGTTMYTTVSPCWRCALMIVQAGVVEVVAAAAYRKVEGLPDPVVYLLDNNVAVRFAS